MLLVDWKESERWWPRQWPFLESSIMQAFCIQKTRRKLDVVKNTLEPNGNERVCVAFWEAKNRRSLMGRTHLLSTLLIRRTITRVQDKVTLMHEPLFDSLPALLAFIQRCHLSSRCIWILSPEFPLVTSVIRNFNYLMQAVTQWRQSSTDSPPLGKWKLP